MNFMYGLECEYPIDATINLLKHYQPIDSPTADLHDWIHFPFQQKKDWLFKKFKKLQDKEKALILRGDHTILPKYLIKDDTGNIELVFKPVKAKSELLKQISFLKETFGLGLLQATVSLPNKIFFNQGPSAYLGWFYFFSEKDFLEKLVISHFKKRLNPQKKLGYFLTEPFLGPLTALKMNRLRKILKYQSQGKWWDQEHLDFISRNASSSKYVGSTVYRPDVAGPERISLEIRDAHRNDTLLLSRVERIEDYLQKDLEPFSSFISIPAFDPKIDFLNLPKTIQALLIKQLPANYPTKVLGHRNVEMVYEVYRNFAYPLRNWEPWIEFLGGSSQDIQLAEGAVKRYLQRLAQTSQNSQDRPSEARWVLDTAIEHLLQFAEESRLLDLFIRWEAIHFPKKAMTSIQQLDGPL